MQASAEVWGLWNGGFGTAMLSPLLEIPVSLLTFLHIFLLWKEKKGKRGGWVLRVLLRPLLSFEALWEFMLKGLGFRG